MRKLVLLAIALLFLTATPAMASPQSDPGGAFTASGGPVVLRTDSGLSLSCERLVLHGIAPTGPSGNPVATFPAFPGAEFSGCVGPIGLTFEVTQVGDWPMNGLSYDSATDTVTGAIDIGANLSGPGCDVEFDGPLDFGYDQSTGLLDIFPDLTVTVDFVDPANNCFGLITQGQSAAMGVTLSVDPIQRFVE